MMLGARARGADAQLHPRADRRRLRRPPPPRVLGSRLGRPSPLADEYQRMVEGDPRCRATSWQRSPASRCTELRRVDFFTCHEALRCRTSRRRRARCRGSGAGTTCRRTSRGSACARPRSTARTSSTSAASAIRSASRSGRRVTPDWLLAPARRARSARRARPHHADPPHGRATRSRRSCRALVEAVRSDGPPRAVGLRSDARQHRDHPQRHQDAPLRQHPQRARAGFEIHAAAGSRLGGVHVELTGEDVTECIGGARGLTESDLERAYSAASIRASTTSRRSRWRC